MVSVCLDYRAALRDTPWGLAQAIEEVRSLRGVLETLEELVDRGDGGRQWASLRLLCAERGPLQNCADELNRLEKKLCEPRWARSLGRRRRALIQAVGWQIRDADVKESLGAIGRYKATLALALTADEAWVPPRDGFTCGGNAKRGVVSCWRILKHRRSRSRLRSCRFEMNFLRFGKRRRQKS